MSCDDQRNMRTIASKRTEVECRTCRLGTSNSEGSLLMRTPYWRRKPASSFSQIHRLEVIIPWKKVLIPRHSEVHERVNSVARNGTKQKIVEKLVLQNSQNNLAKVVFFTNILKISGCRIFLVNYSISEALFRPDTCLRHLINADFFLFHFHILKKQLTKVVLPYIITSWKTFFNRICWDSKMPWSGDAQPVK